MDNVQKVSLKPFSRLNASIQQNAALLCVDRDNGVNNHTGSLPIDGEHSDSGYLRITFYFYEEAETVMIGSIDGLTGKMHFIHFVMSVYKSMFNWSMKALAVHLQDSPQ